MTPAHSKDGRCNSCLGWQVKSLFRIQSLFGGGGCDPCLEFNPCIGWTIPSLYSGGCKRCFIWVDKKARGDNAHCVGIDCFSLI